MKWILHGIAILLVLATAIPIFRGSEWWIRIFDFPRLQIAWSAAILLLIYFIMWRAWKTTDVAILAALFVALLLQVYQIFPYTPIGNKEVRSCGTRSETIRLFNANVLMDNRNAQAYLDLVAEVDPDVALFIETDRWWDEAIEPISTTLPNSVRLPQDNTYGMALYSKFEIIEYEVRHLSDEDVPSIFATLLMPSGQSIRLICLHPRPPRPDKMQDSDERDLELLLAGGFVRETDGAVIVMGDLNDVAWSRTTRLFQKVSQLRDPRRGRGLYSTFHAGNPLFRWPLDHIFLSEEFGNGRIERLANCGSDHFPIIYDLCLLD